MRHDSFRENFVDSCGCKYCLSFKVPLPQAPAHRQPTPISQQNIAFSCLNQRVWPCGRGDVWCPGTKCLGKLGLLILTPAVGSAQLGVTPAPLQKPCLAPWSPATSLPTLLASSDTVIPLTRKVMTPIHYFECHFCKGINQLSVRLDYILILIMLKSSCFLNTFFRSLNFSRAVSHLARLYLAVISPLWKFDRQQPWFSGLAICLTCACCL